MLRVVLDTNVLVSGLRTPGGPPGQILQVVGAGRVSCLFDLRILHEYRVVLARKKFGHPEFAIDLVIEQIVSGGELIRASPLALGLPDESDLPFVEVAVAGLADFLVTGNLRHFPARRIPDVAVVSPRQFLDQLLQPP